MACAKRGMSLGGQSVLTRQGYVMSSPADMRRRLGVGQPGTLRLSRPASHV